MTEEFFRLGIDVGSTTTKLILLDPDGNVLLSSYERHHANQVNSIYTSLEKFKDSLKGRLLKVILTGSGAKTLSEKLHLPYVQEVVANAEAVRTRYPSVRTAIELGGQDAKIIFFRTDPATGDPEVSDMRMNGSCAGGTGAFLDEMASILKVPIAELNQAAEKGRTVYDISGRCGVYAKTDIQPLLNQGASKEDLALSCLHAIAKQTIGGLAQGIPIEAPVLFEGGPLTYVPQLIRVFAERLSLKPEDIVVPDQPQLTVALGAALSYDRLYPPEESAADAKIPADSCTAAAAAASEIPGESSSAAAKAPGEPLFTVKTAGEPVSPAAKTPEESGGASGEASACRDGRGLSAATAHSYPPISFEDLMQRLDDLMRRPASEGEQALGRSYFASQEEYDEFKRRHPDPVLTYPELREGDVVNAYLGIDSGSTTTKYVLIGDVIHPQSCCAVPGRQNDPSGETSQEDAHPEESNRQKLNIIDSFYSPNEGDPIAVAQQALLRTRDRFRAAGVRLNIIAAGSTGYGEMLFSKAFETECHVVETVAHARATRLYEDNTTFLLDIGGQDMKAIWLDHGIITDIVVNEACSSGCGSFLQNFAETLHIAPDGIADAAFRAEHPANLGSRCTVFMNSSIVTEQRNGRLPDEIMAGLCRSIIENVFTKVIRVSNLNSLGDHIVVQGGTFQNDAVLRALEQYLGRNVTRAPYPGLMGAIGAALTAREYAARPDFRPTFIGLDALESFRTVHEANLPCPFCGNHCKRSILRFPNGKTFVTNNRCERGEIVGDPRDEKVREQLRAQQKHKEVPNLFDVRRRLLFEEYPAVDAAPQREETVGLPRVLSYWDTMPFWSTFWRSLGFRVVLSDESTRAMYENGLHAVTSDTLCFPAKLVHGHIRNLADKKVDFIFLPSITAVAPENPSDTSVSMCAVVKGMPIVLRNSDNPEKELGIPLRAPLFHWYTDEDRNRQLPVYMEEHFGIAKEATLAAIEAADKAQASFRTKLKLAGADVIKEVTEKGSYAVVLASRPYQNDPLVNHDLPAMFTQRGIPVLTADSVPGTEEIDLSRSRIDIVNNYHGRMLSCAMAAARNPNLEYVQIVSFGCGHDAYLSDEIIRIMKEISGKTPLVLKLDESNIQGPLRIRVRSFLETVDEKRALQQPKKPQELKDPYPVKFTKKDRREKVVLVPNTSHAFSRIMAAAYARQGITTVSLDIGRENAIRLGKQYVHNDICFPAQVVIGEALNALKSGQYDDCDVAIGMGRYVGDCRLTHYSALLRKALDDAGYEHVPIVTNDDVDGHDMHPGFRMNIPTAMSIAFAMPIIDELEELLRKIRPYEKIKGAAEEAFESAMDLVVNGLREKGVSGMMKGYRKAIEIMKEIPYDRSQRRPQVLIVGEYLLNFHPGANHDIEQYLEDNGMEIIEARMSDVIQKTYFYQHAQNKEYKIKRSAYRKMYLSIADRAFDAAHTLSDRIASSHPLFERPARLPELAKESDAVIHHTFDAGEGILIPGEIIHHAKKGCKSFIILQPFGCLPNHVVGRGITRRLKEMFPDTQILPLDYDPDVSFANLENRLQMLIMNAKENGPARPEQNPHPAPAGSTG